MRIILLDELRDKGIPWSNVHLCRLEAAGKFPKRVKLSEGTGGRVGWLEDEIDKWILDRAALRDETDSPAPAAA
jgi:prophage regulatory protein